MGICRLQWSVHRCPAQQAPASYGSSGCGEPLQRPVLAALSGREPEVSAQVLRPQPKRNTRLRSLRHHLQHLFAGPPVDFQQLEFQKFHRPLRPLPHAFWVLSFDFPVDFPGE